MTASLAAWILLAGGGGLAAWNGVRWILDARWLRRFLTRALGHPGPIRERRDLVRLQRALTSAITYDEERMHEPRSPLRASARETLTRGFGFCGENARAAILLLKAGGVRAHRLYLEGRRWGHVVVEHQWDQGWRLFDAHPDARTLPEPDDLGRIETSDLQAFPNRAEENPWVGSWRVPQLRKMPVVGRTLARSRPPAWVVSIVEHPPAVRCLLGALLAALGAGAMAAS